MVRADPYLCSHACTYYKHPEVYIDNTHCNNFYAAVTNGKTVGRVRDDGNDSAWNPSRALRFGFDLSFVRRDAAK
ncbi:uncharacterized [Tachysurus ichikawai]